MKNLLLLIIALAFWAFKINAQPWTQLAVPATGNVLCLDFVNDYVGYAAGVGGFIWKTTNGGASWSNQTSNTTENLNAMYFIDANTGFAVGDNGLAKRTSDGGATWVNMVIPASASNDFFRGVRFYNAYEGFIVGGVSTSKSTILKTTDGGLTWADLNVPQGTGAGRVIYGVYFTSQNTGFACDFDGRILNTTNGGTTWTATQAAPANYHLGGVYFTSPSTGYVAGGDRITNVGILLKTIDSGTTWSDVTSTIPANNFFTEISFFGQTGFIVGGNVLTNTSAVIYKTTDGGNTWGALPETTVPTVVPRLARVSLPCSHTGYASGLEGTILKVTGINVNSCCDEFHDSFDGTTLVIQATATSGTYNFLEPSGTLPGDILTWDFGDGSPVATGNSPFAPVHHYNQTGSYLATLSVARPQPDGDTCKVKLCQLVEVMVTCGDCEQFLSQANVTVSADMSAWSPTSGPVTFYPFPVFTPYNVRVLWDFNCDGNVDMTTYGNAPATYNYQCGMDSVCYTVECLLSQQIPCYSKPGVAHFNIPCPGNQGNCPNLITNGEFSLGNDGSFTTLNTNPGCTDGGTGTSLVANNFTVKCSGWTGSADHTTGTGNFLIIDGVPAGTGPFDVWRTSSPVIAKPNTTYKFSFWVKTAFAQPTFNLQMAITAGATTITKICSISQPIPTWTKYTLSWTNNSASPTPVNLAIQQMTAGGNRDFGIDDINFSCIDCCDFMADVMDFGIEGTGLQGNTYQFCLSPNISPNDIVEWDLDCDGSIDATSNPCATFTLIPSNHEICATVYRINGGDTCRVKVNMCLPDILADTCTCDSLQNDVDKGFTWSEGSPGVVTIAPNGLTVCDNITWIWGDGTPTSTSSGNTAITHSYANPGSYFVCMIVTRTLPDGTVCDTKEYCETIMTTVAASEVGKLAQGMIAKPNPTAGDVTVTILEYLDIKNSYLRIHSIAGQVMQIVPVQSVEMHLDLQKLPAGIYLLSLHNKEGKLLSKPVKLVKQ